MMARTYALKRLLEHGPMRRSEIFECTGWDRRANASALQRCLETGVVVRRLDHSARRKHDRVLYEAAPT